MRHHAATVALDDPAHNRQAQPGALELIAVVQANEGLKQVRAARIVKAGAVVSDDEPAVFVAAELDARRGRVARKLGCVAEQVAEHHAHQCGAALRRHVLLDHPLDGRLALDPGQVFNHRLGQGTQIDRLQQQRRRSRTSQLEQCGHGMRHLARSQALQAQPLAFVFGQAVPGLAHQQISQARHMPDRCAQFMRQLARKGFQVAVALLERRSALCHLVLENLVAAEQHALGAFSQRDVTTHAVVADERPVAIEARLAADGDPAQAATRLANRVLEVAEKAPRVQVGSMRRPFFVGGPGGVQLPAGLADRFDRAVAEQVARHRAERLDPVRCVGLPGPVDRQLRHHGVASLTLGQFQVCQALLGDVAADALVTRELPIVVAMSAAIERDPHRHSPGTAHLEQEVTQGFVLRHTLIDSRPTLFGRSEQRHGVEPTAHQVARLHTELDERRQVMGNPSQLHVGVGLPMPIRRQPHACLPAALAVTERALDLARHAAETRGDWPSTGR